MLLTISLEIARASFATLSNLAELRIYWRAICLRVALFSLAVSQYLSVTSNITCFALSVSPPEADPNVLRARLREICQQVADDMASHDPPLAAKTVALKLKASSFELRNRQSQCQSFVGFAKTFHKTKGDGSTCEGDVLRVAEELVALTMPHLEAELPCQLRLMGARYNWSLRF